MKQKRIYDRVCAMLKIRLQRVGRVHEPSFRLVLTESENSTKSGNFKEILGSYDPRKTNEALKADRIKYWISQGALLTPSVNNLLITQNVISGKKMHASPSSKKAPVAAEPAVAVSEEPAAPAVESPSEPAPVEEPAPAETPETPAE